MTEALDKQKVLAETKKAIKHFNDSLELVVMLAAFNAEIDMGVYDLPEKTCTLKDRWRVNATNAVSPYYGKCSSCSEDISSFNKYCPFCGARIVEVK